MPQAALSDVVVLELATGVAGPYCGRLLSDLGAQVVKLEPPGGDPCRSELPIVNGESAFYAWLNAGKRNVSLSLDDPRLEPLAAHADIVIHSELGPAADALEARLRASAPSAAIISLSPYGRSGERSAWQTTPIIDYATSGYHYIAGDPAREPLALPGHHVAFHAGMHATVGVLAGLRHARRTGQGQLIELSHQEAILSDHAWITTSWTHEGTVQRREGNSFVPCADGYVYLFGLAPSPNLLVMIERFDLLEDEELLLPLVWRERFGEVLEALAAWTATRTRDEIYHQAQELRIAITPLNTMADVAASQQLEAREWFDELDVGGKSLKAPGTPYRLIGTPCTPSASAAARGADTDVILAASFVWANVDASCGDEPATAAGPLDGLRVIEVTANWAGPIGGRHLADLGADVIKIELATKPATRSLAFTGGQVWPNFHHRSGYFNKLNRNKRAISLDLTTDRGKELFLELIRSADVVLENNAARVMTQLGVPYEVLSKVNPKLVMCSMSGFGATGPERNYSAYGSNIETISGLASVLGYGPGEFYGTGTFYADPVSGTHGAIAILAAVHAAERSGHGQWIDMCLLEAVLPFFAQELLSLAATGETPQPIGNRSNAFAPQGVYPTAGEDCWLAVSVRDVHDLEALCDQVGCGDLGGLAGLSTPEARKAVETEVDGAIAAWAATRDHISAANELQSVGVPAAPVLQNWEIVHDNHLHDRGFFERIRHPVAGTHDFPGFPWRFELTKPTIRYHAPLFAEHNDEVFRGVLGLGDDAIAALYSDGVTSDDPVFAAGPSL